MALKESTKKEQANSYELVVTVDGETFERAINTVYKKQVKNINVQGFRKGKAPRRMIEKLYGKEVFYDDAMQDCYPDALYNAAQEAGVRIVAVESLEALEAGENGFTFKADIIVEPEVEVENYKGIEITKKSTEVTQELLDEEIKKVRERSARMVDVTDRPAQLEDTVVIDFEGFLDGEPFEGGKAEGHTLVLGSGSFIPGFEEQVVGHGVGEEFTITVTFPEDYQAEELKGKEAQFKIVLHEIKFKELPEFDDEFVQDVSDKDTVEEYKKELEQTVADRLKDESEKDVDEQLRTKLADLVEGEIPEKMYDNRVDEMVRDFEMNIRSQGIDFNTYIQYFGMDLDSIKSMYRDQAQLQVKLRLALEAIAKKENLEVKEEDIQAEYERLAELYKTDVDKVKTAVPSDSISDDLKTQKAFDFVKDNAVIE